MDFPLIKKEKKTHTLNQFMPFIIQRYIIVSILLFLVRVVAGFFLSPKDTSKGISGICAVI